MAVYRSMCSSDQQSGIRFEHDWWQRNVQNSCPEEQSKSAAQSLWKTACNGRDYSDCTKMACHLNGQTSGPFQRRNRTSLAARKLNMKPEKNSSRENVMAPMTSSDNEDRELTNFKEENNDPLTAVNFYRSFSKENSTEKNAGNSFGCSSRKICVCSSPNSRRVKSCSALPSWSRQENHDTNSSPRRSASATVARPQGKDGAENVHVRSDRDDINEFASGKSNVADYYTLVSLLDEKDRVIAEQESELQRILLEKQDVLTGLSSTSRDDDSDATAAQLCKDLDSGKRQLAKLEEDNKTLALKLELEEDLRRNDKECIDMLRKQIHEIEDKLQASDRQLRELEHEKRRLQSTCKCSPAAHNPPPQAQPKVPDLLKLKYKLELNQATINAIENEYAKLKESKMKLEETHQHDQEVLIELRHQLANSQADNNRKEERINQLEEERHCLEDYQRKCRSLQRRDQKSCYALQLQIVDLQEKLETSEKVLKESQKERTSERQKIEKLEENMKKLEGKYRTKLEEALNRVKSLKARALKDNLLSTEKFNEELNSWKIKTQELEAQNSSLRNELESKTKGTSTDASSNLVQGPLDSAFVLLEELVKSRGKLNGINTTNLIDSLEDFIKESFIPEGKSLLVTKKDVEEKSTSSVSTKEAPVHNNGILNVSYWIIT